MYISYPILKVMLLAQSLAPIDIQNARDYPETPEWAHGEVWALTSVLMLEGVFGKKDT